LTDEHGGERMDRIPVVKGEIRLADRAYMQPDRIAAVIEAGADIVVRSGWRNARWLDANCAPVSLLTEFENFPASRSFFDGRYPRALSPEVAHRTRLQTAEKPDRPEGAARCGRALRQALCACPSFGYSSARTADRRVRGLSPLGTSRLTTPGAWRLLLQLTATLLQAIMPQ